MAIPEYTAGDTWPPITGTCKDAAGNPVDLTGADSLEFRAKNQGGAGELVTGTATKDAGTGGTWTYPPAVNDLTAAGTYDVAVKVTWDSTTTPPEVETFPGGQLIVNPAF